MIELTVVAAIIFAAAIGWLLFNKFFERPKEPKPVGRPYERRLVQDTYREAEENERLSFYRAQRQMFRDIEAAKGETPPWRQ
ncbi:hypothetical protein [Rhodococcus sp. IEGM 1374]|uniref:hypothetical protein n=1 Tax=Rhodococcus sp. IEGM 1374 TaxID=3082221 RepID=UPI002955211B|nr:hypothetical protein [Rhodococcus sp. IEGM 1374]MDV7990499.1 hypothetical protein [Rhodococcus sp. IEGM 1374]